MSMTKEEELLELRKEILQDYEGLTECPAWILNIDKKLQRMLSIAGVDIQDSSLKRTLIYKGYCISVYGQTLEGDPLFWYEVEGDTVEYSCADDGNPGYMTVEEAVEEAKAVIEDLESYNEHKQHKGHN